MFPKLALACLFSAICVSAPVLAQGAVTAEEAKLSALEVKFFAHPYKHDLPKERAARLESFVFGARQADLSLAQRITKLLALVTIDTPTVQQKRAQISISPKPFADKSTYPRISELEQEVFDLTFESEPVRHRLDRLETRVFGKPSELTDLAVRADILKYSFFTSAPQIHQPTELVSFHQDSLKQEHFVSVVDGIESLEKLAFGVTHSSKRLEQRVAALEQQLGGSLQVDTNMTLTMRVSQLLTKVRASAARNVADQS